jgi:hypothetical protein
VGASDRSVPSSASMDLPRWEDLTGRCRWGATAVGEPGWSVPSSASIEQYRWVPRLGEARTAGPRPWQGGFQTAPVRCPYFGIADSLYALQVRFSKTRPGLGVGCNTAVKHRFLASRHPLWSASSIAIVSSADGISVQQRYSNFSKKRIARYAEQEDTYRFRSKKFLRFSSSVIFLLSFKLSSMSSSSSMSISGS